MSREICPTCHGVGEATYPTSLGENFTMELRTCETCWGSCFERPPTLKSMINAREALERAVKALEES